MKLSIMNCARCGKSVHKDVQVYKLTNPFKQPGTNGRVTIGYWGMCPDLNEPILITVLEEV